MREEVSEYDASHIEVLEGREAIRKRPGMFVGSTGERGLHHMVYEVAGRAVNEVRAGLARTVAVTLTADGGVRVDDDGPGVPVRPIGSTKSTGSTGSAGDADLEALLTRLNTATEPEGRHTVSLGPFDVGLLVTNALSSRLRAEVCREGVRWVQEYAYGVALAPPTAAGPATGSGTTIAFWPDPDIFETVECSFAALAERFREAAFLDRSLDITLTDERPATGIRSTRVQFPDGPRDFVAFLDGRPEASPLPDVIGFAWEDDRMAGTAEVAFRWSGSHEERLRGFANSRPTHEGGTHVEGFRDGVTAAVTAYARKRSLLTATAPDLGADQWGTGLTAVVSVNLDRPVFQGATRSRLGGDTVRARVAEAVQEHFGTWLEKHPEQAGRTVADIVRNAGRHQRRGTPADTGS